MDIRNATAETAMIACQGPRAQDALQPLADRDLSEIPPFRVRAALLRFALGFVSRAPAASLRNHKLRARAGRVLGGYGFGLLVRRH